MQTARTWQLQEAKARLSELVRRARDEGPQMITVRGDETAVVISSREYERLSRPKKSVVDVLLSAPTLDLPDDELAKLFARDKSPGRDVSFDD